MSKFSSAEILIIIVIVYGSILNLLAKPWSSSDSTLERRRNDLVAASLWIILIIIAAETVRKGIISIGSPTEFDLQDWTALILPFAVAAPYLLELAATLIRQLEMWQWMHRATIQTLPIAWMYRTMTIGEVDKDGQWLAREYWKPVSHPDRNGFWHCTSRKASLFHVLGRWMEVLLSAMHYGLVEMRSAAQIRDLLDAAKHGLLVVLVFALVTATGVIYSLSALEVGLLLLLDFVWWRVCHSNAKIVSVYSCVHFGRAEMQLIFEYSSRIRAALSPSFDGVDASFVYNRIMGAVITTAAVLENGFRNAYLVTPVYNRTISDRKVLRDRYNFVGCHLDKLIKAVRVILEFKHTAGLMSITSTGIGTAEAALHNNIESVLSIAIFFEPITLYKVTSRIAKYERAIEKRVMVKTGEVMTRETVTYIDARNAVYWLLWVVVTREWRSGIEVWGCGWNDHSYSDEECAVQKNRPYNEQWIDSLYVIATFLSRCRYAKRFGIGKDSEKGLFSEVKALCDTEEKREAILQTFEDLSQATETARGIDLITWTELEYDLHWERNREDGSERLRCGWSTAAGKPVDFEVSVVMED